MADFFLLLWVFSIGNILPWRSKIEKSD